MLCCPVLCYGSQCFCVCIKSVFWFLSSVSSLFRVSSSTLSLISCAPTCSLPLVILCAYIVSVFALCLVCPHAASLLVCAPALGCGLWLSCRGGPVGPVGSGADRGEAD